MSDFMEDIRLWANYGLYCNRCIVNDTTPLLFEEWLEDEPLQDGW